MGSHSLIDYILAVGGITATFGAVFVAFYLNRRSSLEETVQENTTDIAHIEGHLETESEGRYRPRPR